MKLKIYFVLFLMFYLKSFSQNTENQIKKDIDNYLKIFVDKDFSKISQYSYPEMKKYIDEEEYVEDLKESFRDREDVKISIFNAKVNNISELYHIDNVYYSIIDYSNIISFDFSRKDEEETSTIIEALESAYGDGNVFFFPEEKIFKALVHKIIIAKSKDGKANWKFLVLHGNNEFVNMIIPINIFMKIFK